VNVAANENDLINAERQPLGGLQCIHSFDLRLRQPADNDAGNPFSGLECLKIPPNHLFGVGI
jgi:hypothetical protein